MEQILAYIESYGLPVFVIATCIILLIGILKVCKLFDKIENKNVKKFIYYALDVALAFGGAAIYFAIFKLNWAEYVMFSAAQVSATTTLYAIYENFGVRKLVQILLNWVSGWFKANPNHKLTKLAQGLGWDTAIAEIQKAKAEAEAKAAAEATTEVKK